MCSVRVPCERTVCMCSVCVQCERLMWINTGVYIEQAYLSDENVLQLVSTLTEDDLGSLYIVGVTVTRRHGTTNT